MPYIIKRTNQWGGYLTANTGSRSTYVTNPKHAKKFTTREAAAAACCPGNEIPVPYEPKKSR